MARHWIVESGECHYTAQPADAYSLKLCANGAGLDWAVFEAETEEEALDLAREWDERVFVYLGQDEACETRAEGAYRIIRTAVLNGWIPELCGLEMALHVVVNAPNLLHD